VQGSKFKLSFLRHFDKVNLIWPLSGISCKLVKSKVICSCANNLLHHPSGYTTLQTLWQRGSSLMPSGNIRRCMVLGIQPRTPTPVSIPPTLPPTRHPTPPSCVRTSIIAAYLESCTNPAHLLPLRAPAPRRRCWRCGTLSPPFVYRITQGRVRGAVWGPQDLTPTRRFSPLLQDHLKSVHTHHYRRRN